jgi:hypothetical protein
LPKASKAEMSTWSTTPPPWERKSQSLYRKNDVDAILKLFTDLPPKKSVLIEGAGGAGKSTTIIELAASLDDKKVDYSLLSAKYNEHINNSVENSSRAISQLATQLSSEKGPNKDIYVLIDSGDYLFSTLLDVNQSYLELLSKQSYTEKEREALTRYRSCSQLLTILQKPNIKIVSTWHPNWPEKNREQTLFQQWEKIFPKDTRFALSPKVSVESGIAYLSDRNDLITSSCSRVALSIIAGVFDFHMLKELTPSQFRELGNLLSGVTHLNMEKGLDMAEAWKTTHFPTSKKYVL